MTGSGSKAEGADGHSTHTLFGLTGLTEDCTLASWRIQAPDRNDWRGPGGQIVGRMPEFVQVMRLPPVLTRNASIGLWLMKKPRKASQEAHSLRNH